jgi:hypothetical protein
MLKFSFHYILIFLILVSACKGKQVRTRESVKHKYDSALSDNVKKPKSLHKKINPAEIPDTIYNDTIRACHYQTYVWSDSVITKDYKAVFLVKVDTSDPIIDTIKSLRGRRITIGYNHNYWLIFSKNDKPWFTLSLNKRRDLESLIGGTDYWLESNLNVFHRLVYNEKFQKFVVEFEINPLYNFGSDYYFVFDTHGRIDYTGTAGSWGGGNPDGLPFISDDFTSYITCFEIYNFKNNTSIPLSDFVASAEYKAYGSTSSDYKWLHGLRNLTRNNFLAVFNRNDSTPDFNALIINTDTTLVSRFKYYGLMEEMNAEFLFQYDTLNNLFYVYDTDREKLISIDEKNPSSIKEYYVSDMIKVRGDTMKLEKFRIISFEVFGNYRFYKDHSDSEFYCDIDKLE